MVWLALILAFLFIWGGILAVKPSPHQKRLAGLREQAMKRGMRITLGSQLKLETGYDHSRLVAYRRYRSRALPGCQGWIWRDENGQIQASNGCFRQPDVALRQQLASLPNGCRLVAAGSGDVLVAWDESGGVQLLEQIAQYLEFVERWTVERCTATPEKSSLRSEY